MSPEQTDKFVHGFGTVGQHTVAAGTRVIVAGVSGSKILGDAAGMAANAALGCASPEEKAIAASGAMVGAASCVKVAILVGGIGLAPAAAFAAMGAAVVGGATFGLVKLFRVFAD